MFVIVNILHLFSELIIKDDALEKFNLMSSSDEFGRLEVVLDRLLDVQFPLNTMILG